MVIIKKVEMGMRLELWGNKKKGSKFVSRGEANEYYKREKVET